MLKITIPSGEIWDESTQQFLSNSKEQTIELEHSLVSLSKWESKWKKPFLTVTNKSQEELIDYIKCMTLTKNVNEIAYSFLSRDNFNAINNYIEDSMTATTFREEHKSPGKSETLTAEVIYYYMIALGIPSEYRKWHLNKLLTLIKVCNIKNSPPTKMNRREVMSRNAALNAARKQQLNTRG